MRDKLKGKRIMVWTFMGNPRMYQALRDYGDRIDTIGLFSFKVDATGTITESGVAISNMLTYIEKWPHIRWLLTVANDGANSIFKAIRDNTDGAQDTFCSELIRIMEKYPWCNGVDIDLEKGDGYSTHEASTAMFKHIYETVKAYDSTKEMNICLPGMTSVNGSVGGENWSVYGDLDQYCDTASIMSYGMAWAGSAPGPVSPRSWLEGIYDYATQVMNPDKVFLGMPAYGWNWQIYDTPENLGKYYRGTSHTYYAAKYWMQGLYNFTDDAPPQPFIPIVSYWDDYDMGPWALPHVYDYMEGRDAVYKEYPQMAEVYNRRRYLTAYAKQQKTEFGDIIIDRNAEPDSYGGVVSVSETLVTLGDEGTATYKFTIDEGGTYDVAIRLCYPFWDKNSIYASLDGSTVHFSEDRIWWPYWRTTFWATLAKGVSLTAGEHTLTISVGVNGVQFYGFRVCTDFSEEPTAGQAEYALAPRKFKDVNGDMVGPAAGFKLTLEMLRRKPDSALVWYRYQNRYCFSGKIKCGECGGTFKRRQHYKPSGDYVAWTCGTHLESKKDCSMLYISDEGIKFAFLTMMNKLVYGHNAILKPLLRTLRGMDDKDRLLRIQELEIQIEGNIDRKQILTNLMATGVLEPAVFNKENNALVAEEQQLRAEKEKLVSFVGGDKVRMKELQKLMSFTSKGEMQTAFSDEMFLEFVDSITVETRHQIVFHLKCGLNLAERLVM